MITMDDKIFNVRIGSRYDIESDWETIDPVLFEGELAIITRKSDKPNSPPEVCIKSGDGIHKYSELPFISANALDIYNWAKQPSKPVYHADEIIGLKTFKHTHKIEDILGLQEELDKRGDLSIEDGATSGTITGPLGQSIIANADSGLMVTQNEEGNIFLSINKNITFLLDGGTSAQFQT